ncbi:hypothetical protein ACFQX4_20510 [Roseomonas sp. GCM10028921]
MPDTWFGLDGLTAEQIGRQIATASARIEALTAELARRAKGEDREIRQ